MTYDPLLTRRQVADIFSVHPETIKRMEHRGEIEAVRLNTKNVRYRASEVDRIKLQATVPRQQKRAAFQNLTLNSGRHKSLDQDED